jgi:thiosulfate reductase cytochrome b subunit
MAVCVFILLGTGFLPIVGIKFEWVTIHWVAGVALLVLVILHIVRAVSRGHLKSMWFGWQDIKIALAPMAKTMPEPKPGKYSPAQKLMHHGVTGLVLLTLATGLVMMVKVDTPFWERNPYLLDAGTWGIIYALHGFAALSLITTVMLHVYFALRPEKLMYTRSMIKGWLTRSEFLEHHDPEKWQVK